MSDGPTEHPFRRRPGRLPAYKSLQPDVDLPARGSLLWSGRTPVATRQHAGRTVAIYERVASSDLEPTLCCTLSSPDDPLEGVLEVFPIPAPALVWGTLNPNRLGIFSGSIEPFIGGAAELADLVCGLIDCDYKFPPDSGVERIGDSWFP